MNAAKLIYRHIPAQIRGSKSRAQRAAEGSAPIFLPPVLSPYLKRWRDHPLEFHLPLPGKRTQNNGQDTDSSALVAAFIRCSSFVDSIVVDKVRLRFYYVMFYLLSKEIIPQGTFNSDVEALLSSTIVRSGLVESDKKNVQVKLHDWIDFGERLWLLSDDLGGPGILFLLPDDIPDNTYVSVVVPLLHRWF